ncbi:GumC family protein [Pseudochelatococcus sp. B33]
MTVTRARGEGRDGAPWFPRQGWPADNPDGRLRPAARRVTLRDILIAMSYYRRIGVLVALIPLVIGIVAALETRTEYTADGLLMVLVTREQSGNQGLTDSGPAVLSIEGLKVVESEVSIIGSADVVRATIDEIGADRLFPDTVTWWRPILSLLRQDDAGDRLVERFRDALGVRTQAGSNIIQVSFRHPDRNMAILTADTLIRNYLERRRKLFDNPRSGLLAEHVQTLSMQLAAKETELQRTKADAGVIDIVQDRLLAANQVDSVIQRTRQVRERREAVIGQLAVAQAQTTETESKVFDFLQRSNAATNDDDSNMLTRLQAERVQLLGKYAPGHPAIQTIDRQIAAVREIIRNPEQKIAWTDREVRNPAISFLTNMVINLTVERDAIDRQLTELASQRATAEKRVEELREADTLLTRQTREYDILTSAYQEYVRRAETARMEEEAAALRFSNVRLVQSPQDAVTSRNMALPFLVAGLFGSVLFGGAAVASATALRSTFISPGEVERATHLPLLAVFPDTASDFAGGGAGGTVSALVTRLFSAPVDDRSLAVLMLADVGAGDDRARLTRAIVRELSAGRGQKVLLIETSAAGSEAGSGDVVSEPGAALSAYGAIVTQGAVDGLHIARIDSAALLGVGHSLSGSLRQLFDALRSQYAVVLLSVAASDNVPLTEYLAASVDATLLVVRAERSREPALLWLRDTLLDAGGGIVGIVFTGRKFYLPERIYRWS